MESSPETLQKIDSQISRSDATICRHIDNLDLLGRDIVSQDVLSNLRTFVEHIMFKIYAHSNHVSYNYTSLDQGIKYVRTQAHLKFLTRFHSYLQIVSSHYTLEPEDSERVMLKYYEFMIKTKEFLQTNYNLTVLANLNKFPLCDNKNLQEYYEKIAQRITSQNEFPFSPTSTGRYYIQKIKPFFINHKIYYEVTFTPATENANKSDRIIAFTALDISKYYSVKLWTVESNIEILDKKMPILIIVKWEVAIRPIEIRRFSNIFNLDIISYSNSSEGRALMEFLTNSGFNLVELILFDEVYYQITRQQILSRFNAKVSHLFDLFDKCRNIISKNLCGSTTLRYLLYHMNNEIIKKQLDDNNSLLSGLCLSYGCIPFDQMPFCTSLPGHNPRLGDLFDCIPAIDKNHELLSRCILANTEQNAQLYTPKSELTQFEKIDFLTYTFNKKLYNNTRHQARRIKEKNGCLYIDGYEKDTISILNKLITLSNHGVQNYTQFVEHWLSSGINPVDCDEKKATLRTMFAKSSVAIIYGSAGTGKSTLINHIANLFQNQSKLFLANTNPAVDNMKRRVTTQTPNTEFLTITKFIKKQGNQTNYNILIIDECSTVSNADMNSILNKATFDLLVLVGDIYQIAAIRFGNWFSIAKGFLPTSSIYELKHPYRSNNLELQTLWDKVRNMDDTIIESIAKNQYSSKLDNSIFETITNDEIILCLNYDGLYGINNINRFLQEVNPNPPQQWGLQTYKIGDPILFNNSDRFAPLIYNNIKGRIQNIQIQNNRIIFDIEVDKVFTNLDTSSYDFKLLSSASQNSSIIQFHVDSYDVVDENKEAPITAIVPFQVAYAVSIHKAQGLEYSSVKIVISDEVGDHITHNIFYTAITRAREKLKIYWTPETEHKILNTIKPKNHSRDIQFLHQIIDAT